MVLVPLTRHTSPSLPHLLRLCACLPLQPASPSAPTAPQHCCYHNQLHLSNFLLFGFVCLPSLPPLPSRSLSHCLCLCPSLCHFSPSPTPPLPYIVATASFSYENLIPAAPPFRPHLHIMSLVPSRQLR